MTSVASLDRELVEMLREARHRAAEKVDPTYRRRPVDLAEHLVDLEDRLLRVRSARGDEASLRRLAENQLAFKERIREMEAENRRIEAAIQAEPEEEEPLWA